MSEVIKDFMGDELHVGDNVVISDRTYSKTPYMKYCKITEIKEPVYFKNGKLDHIDIKLDVLGRSDKYLTELNDINFKYEPDRWGNTCGFRYSYNCYINILKVK